MRDNVIDVPLPDLAPIPLRMLLAEPDEPSSTLDAVMQRLFDPRERDLLTVSAFSSSL